MRNNPARTDSSPKATIATKRKRRSGVTSPKDEDDNPDHFDLQKERVNKMESDIKEMKESINQILEVIRGGPATSGRPSNTYKDRLMSQEVTQKNQPEEKTSFKAIFEGDKIMVQHDVFEIAEQIKKFFPEMSIKSAFVSKDKQLIIYVTKEDDYKKITTDQNWLSKSFEKGISLINKKSRYYFCIRNCFTKLKDENDEIRKELEEEYGIVNATNIIKKSTNSQTGVVKLETDSKEKYEKIMSDGCIYLGLTRFKVSKWNSPGSINLCFNCQETGHKKENCKKKTVCPLCTEEHQLKECTKSQDKLKCYRCGEKHPVFSRKCKENMIPTKASYTTNSNKQQKAPALTDLGKQIALVINDVILKCDETNMFERGDPKQCLKKILENRLPSLLANVIEINETVKCLYQTDEEEDDDDEDDGMVEDQNE
jgi:hypothetical protein